MAKKVLLNAFSRKNIGRIGVNKIRATGMVPAVIYGVKEPEALQVKALDLANILNSSTSEHMLVDLEIESEKSGKARRMAVIQDVQHHPIKDTLIHVDFHEVNENMELHIEVPLMGLGEPVGVRTSGGVLETLHRTIKVACLPKDLPEKIEVEISNLGIDDSVCIKDIKLPAGVKAMQDEDIAVFIVHAPKVAEEETPATTAEATEPEVIKEKKEKEEEK